MNVNPAGFWTRLLGMVIVATGLGWAVPTLQDAPVRVDPGLLPYRPVTGISGNLSSVGSDTLNNLMTFWSESFGKSYPSVKIQIEGKGSATAPPALTNGTAQLGPMSRPMKATEEDAFDKKWGYKPTQIRTAVDALAIFVNKDNPIKSLTLAQADAIFSKARRRGAKEEITTWGQLGLGGEWASRPISLYGRNSVSGTYGFFKEHVLKNGDFKDKVNEQAGSSAVVQSVTNEIGAIGYSGIGYATAGVRAVPLRETENEEAVEATATNSYSGAYPLARFLLVYINRAPGRTLDPLVREFIKLVLSREGQEVVLKDNFFPIPHAIAQEDLKKIE